jgi:hypothetical protein
MAQMLENDLRKLNDDQKHRLWEHGLHEDTMFNNRLNFFLVFESILLSVVGSLYSKLTPTKVILITIVCLGIVITIIWGYVQARQKHTYDVLGSAAREVFDEFVIIRTRIGKWPVSSVALLTYAIPGLVLLIWIVLLIAVIVI